MKVGSLVVIVGGNTPPPEHLKHLIKWDPICDGETIYTIRGFHTDGVGRQAAVFEEGIIGYHNQKEEIGICTDYLREIQPPMDLTEVIEECMCQEAIL